MRDLEAEPWRYSFFQCVRILQRAGGNRAPAGAFSRPEDAAVQFAADTAMAFPASEVQSIEIGHEAAVQLRANILGCTGPMGVLPLVYTALLRERERGRDYATRDFLDLFHNRLLALFYRAWEKYRFGVAFERGERDRLSHHLSDLIGIGGAGLEEQQDVPDMALQFYAGLLSMQTRPALALEQLVSDYFGVHAEVEQFVGAWHSMDKLDECRLGEDAGVADQLGVGALAGDRIWNEQACIRIRLGPMSIAQYEEFLPGGGAWKALRALARFYAGMESDIEAELILRRDEVPDCELEVEPDSSVRLGWTTWVKSAPFQRDPADTILQMEQAA